MALLDLTFGQSILYILFCSSFDLIYDEVGHEQRFRYIPFVSRPSYAFDTLELFKNNLRLKSGKI